MEAESREKDLITPASHTVRFYGSKKIVFRKIYLGFLLHAQTQAGIEKE